MNDNLAFTTGVFVGRMLDGAVSGVLGAGLILEVALVGVEAASRETFCTRTFRTMSAVASLKWNMRTLPARSTSPTTMRFSAPPALPDFIGAGALAESLALADLGLVGFDGLALDTEWADIADFLAHAV